MTNKNYIFKKSLDYIGHQCLCAIYTEVTVHASFLMNIVLPINLIEDDL